MQTDESPLIGRADADLICPNPKGPKHLLKNPVRLPCCPGVKWCRTCAGLTILQNNKRCYAGCGRHVQQKDLATCQITSTRLQILAASENSDSDSDSIHTLGDMSEATGHVEEYTQLYQEDITQRLIITPTNYKDPTQFPYKRSISLGSGGLSIHALISEVEDNIQEIPRQRPTPKWRPQLDSWSTQVKPKDSKKVSPPNNNKKATTTASEAELQFRTEDAEYFARTGDTTRDCRGRPIPQIWYTNWDDRGAYIAASELLPGLSPVLMGIRDHNGEIWWQTTDKVTNNVHQVWLESHTRPESPEMELLAEYARQHWPREDLVGIPGRPGNVRLMVARGHSEPESGPSMTTTDTSEGEEAELGLSEEHKRKRRRLITKKQRARERRRRNRDGTPIGKWLTDRFPDIPKQTGPVVTRQQPLHKSRVWLDDINTKKKRLHSSFQPWYPNHLNDWLIMGRTPDPTALNNAYIECDFENWRWMHHTDDKGNIWLIGYEHRTGPRQGRFRKSYRTLKVVTILDKTDSWEQDPIEQRDRRICALQQVAKHLREPIMVCSSAYREVDHFTILEGMGWPEWSKTKRKSYRACYNWRQRTAVDQDMEPMGPHRSWPEVISFINGFIGGYYDTEIQALKQIKNFEPEEENPRLWWAHVFPQECRRAKMHMATIAAKTLDSLRKDTTARTAANRKTREGNQAEYRENQDRAWWRTRRWTYIRPTPTPQTHRPGAWKLWSRTPHQGGWDGWSIHEESRPQQDPRLHPDP